MNKSRPSTQVYDRITARIVDALKEGTVPWRKSWKSGNAAAPGLPHNATTGRPYRGMNVWVLMMEAEENGYESTGWITPKQALAAELDFKGQQTTEVLFWKKSTRKVETDTGDEESRTFMWCKGYRVLNLDQCKGDKSKLKGNVTDLRDTVEEIDDLAVAVSQGLELEVKHGGDRAFYQPTRDFICLPPEAAFTGPAAYRATLLHEGVHATGHSKRLDRKFGARFGDAAYAFEELIAELGSTYLQAALGIDMDLPHHASYLDHWVKVLEGDHKAILTAASQAQKAVDFLLDRLEIADAPEYEEAA